MYPRGLALKFVGNAEIAEFVCVVDGWSWALICGLHGKCCDGEAGALVVVESDGCALESFL